MSPYFTKKYVPLYFVLAFVFRYIFMLIPPLFIKDTHMTPYVMDADLMERWAFFKTDYIELCKKTYDVKDYWRVYFPLDTAFPFVYSLFFISTASFLSCYQKLFNFLSVLILAGAIFDWLENLSFGIFLGYTSNGLAPVVSFFSTIKSILFGINLLTAAAILLYCAARWLLVRKPLC